jgi:diadenosine tetraphosphate (Ap4A) HIT family hydrolase
MQNNCPFCAENDGKPRMIVENKLAWAFPTNIPITPGHVLICPLRCVPTWEQLTDEEKTAIFDLRSTLRDALIKIFGAEGFHYAWNEGAVAGQSVPHFHLHMIPRKAGDEGITEYEPRKFLYRPGSRAETPQAELIEIASLIRKNIDAIPASSSIHK